MLHNDPALGGYIYGVFSFLLVTEMNNLDFFKLVTFILKQILRCYYVTFLKTWGLQVIGI